MALYKCLQGFINIWFPSCSAQWWFIALNFKMFIALITLIFSFMSLLLLALFQITREFIILPTPFFGAKSSLSYNNVNLHPVFSLYAVLSIVTFLCLYGFSPLYFCTIIFYSSVFRTNVFCTSVFAPMYFALQINYLHLYGFSFTLIICVPCHFYTSLMNYQHFLGPPRQSLDRYGG